MEDSLKKIGLEIKVLDCFYKFFKASTTVRKANTTYNSETPMLCFAINPEDKRKIIGDTFLKVANEAIKELKLDPNEVFVAQGTLRPDLIESASELVSTNADTIKTHHNDTELVRQLRAAGSVCEPLKDFHKDEVRKLGRDLGLPDALVDRHPFPGPGLAIRILCAAEPFMEKDFSETQVSASIHRFKWNFIWIEICFWYDVIFQVIAKVIVEYHTKLQKNHALLNRVTNATSKEQQDKLEEISKRMKVTATLLPIRSVGVQGVFDFVSREKKYFE